MGGCSLYMLIIAFSNPKINHELKIKGGCQLHPPFYGITNSIAIRYQNHWIENSIIMNRLQHHNDKYTKNSCFGSSGAFLIRRHDYAEI